MSSDRVVFVSRWERPYKAFQDREGREVPAGATRWVSWVPEDGSSEPVRVKVSQEVFDLFGAFLAGEVIEVDYSMIPAGSGVWRLQVETARPAVAAHESA